MSVERDFSIRLARKDDAPAIARLHVQAWQESYKGIIDQAYLDAISYEDRLILRKKILANTQQGFLNLVVVCKGKIVGFCDSGPNQNTSLPFKGEIYAIYLYDDFKHWGIGAELFKASREHFTIHGLVPFVARVLEDNKPACAFYEKYGGIKFSAHREQIGTREYNEISYIFNEL